MRTLKLNIVIGVIFLSLVGFVAMTTAEQEEFDSNLIFSHQLHVEDNEMECETCHADVIEGNTLKADLIVKEETCLECHDREDPGCTFCHTNPKGSKFNRPVNEYLLTYSHDAHMDRGLTCEKCHIGVVESENLNRRHSPEMSSCMVCHDVTENMDDCYLCHHHEQDLKPNDHDAMWAANHGKFSEAGSQDCKTCHTNDYCTECHLGENLFAESHPPEFILTHSMSFLARESDCFTCHENRDYCVDCHVNINFVVPVTHSIPNWKPINKDGSSLHIIEGRLNPEYCSVCHEGEPSAIEQSCIGCHSGWDR